ncbi:DISARM system helicase DrmA [Burkholderia pseudomallei]|uniref:DISARM system helicase DrmA n=1 Tax=Burkholderia pseudomallei TaxID=28450 RepID=UPI001A964790|nr:DISARM system helicase DrmA [Burkholderia pseudomallei]QSY07379.1 DISARM system helicase DrmA [Burkholderia pseudomallei]QSY15164.1 DISARM system helicase DrmA [Burkholderia pseudomallei]QTB63119.1 DISARM system helicase DrmA [Burkholderia pseudomallei]
MTTLSNAWIAIEHGLGIDRWLAPYTLVLKGDRSLYQAIAEDDWLLVLNHAGEIVRIGRVLRVRSDLETTTIFFDRVTTADAPVPVATVSLAPPPSGNVGRIQWEEFVAVLSTALHQTVAGVPVIEDRAYIRELLQLAVVDDLLGPAGGPHERIVDMSVRDRYLVGKLAPRETAERGQEFPVDPNEVEDDADDLIVKTQQEKNGAPIPKGLPESEPPEEIDAASNQSLVPSSLGMTFCVDGDVERIEVEARWGCYVRIPNDQHHCTKIITRKIRNEAREVVRTVEEEVKCKVWQRIPCGGKLTLSLTDGVISHRAPDKNHPEVRLQGSVRAKNANGDRLVTLFLVNAQDEPPTNKDAAWLFQPELIVRAEVEASNRAIFRRRSVLTLEPGTAETDDLRERLSLEMIYRNRVEFAVGHGVAVHAETADNVTLATEVRTAVLPQYEVQVTETPGLNPADRPAMKEMVASGLLDMQRLATLEVTELVDALNLLTKDYASWIAEQRERIGEDVVGYDAQAAQALDRCQEIQSRLQQGIDTLKSNEKALTAFRFANRAMAIQRVRSQYALEMRRGRDVTVDQFNLPKNRSWRPFQLAFLLLSIPSLADPTHPDRVQPMEAHADLLWFPTGGGKTEAYLGVAAFTMAIRRLQGKLGGYDGSRGLAVIMRYTLRLLTLQQFQRATALICAMEVLRREALASGDPALGHEPFTIGLWVGNKVTPGTTEDSHRAIEDIRNPGKYHAGAATPVQLTSCPWCGSDTTPGRDVEVDKNHGRTLVYCGDKKGRCEFSRGKSSKSPHPGIPVLTVDEEIYHRPPTMMIATVDKFAMMAWRGQVRTLFGRVSQECERHGLLWHEADCCTGNHQAGKGLPAVKVKNVAPIRPPDLIIQDEFHLISGPLGTMVGLYESAVDELSGWTLDGKTVKPKIVASTATVRKAKEQVNNVFMRHVSVFPPHGLDVEDNYFSVQRPIGERPGRRYLGVCSPGSSRPAMLIRVYTAFLTAAQALFDRFGELADPYMTMVGYFNSLRELGGMRRLAEDDVQTRSFRVQMSMVKRPALKQRSVNNIRELTSRVSSQDIPKYLDDLEVKFKATFDAAAGKYVAKWNEGDTRAIDVVLATNMLSVGVDVNRLGLMAVNGQPKGTAEYIQATSRVGRSFPGLVCTVLTWARPRDLSHYETFEHFHATFYKHVEAQSVTPFSPRAMDRGLTGALLSLMRLENDAFSPNVGASALDKSDKPEIAEAIDVLVRRAWNVSETPTIKNLAERELKERADEWAKEVSVPGRTLAYEKRGAQAATMVGLVKSPGIHAWDNWTVPMSMREVEPGVRLIMNTGHISDDHGWKPRPVPKDED